jgi:hypothetical protein
MDCPLARPFSYPLYAGFVGSDCLYFGICPLKIRRFFDEEAKELFRFIGFYV